MSTLLAGVRPGWIPFGWFVCAAITSLALFGFIAVGVVGGDPAGGDFWVAASLALGFWLGGLFVGTRVAAAPVAHGLGIGLFSVVVWFVANLVLGEATDQTAWSEMDGMTLVSLLMIQAVAAIVGARIGVRWVRRGR